ncbi:MAG: oxygen-independent coproporphyrinogen III oxidase [Verrucomicrobia bacterium]|nr:MAG: oxygen-independent coproporphyrinogen III oxidase [Verrucomicrobiota bacterium]
MRKYNRPGPRYTSYPTALQFTGDFDQQAIIEDIRANNRSPRPLSLYFHLPFCETLCWFCGCTTVITLNRGKADRYLDFLERELELTAPLIHRDARAVQMHFGGGTPNFFGPAQIDRLAAMIRRYFTFTDDAEISVEIDPRRLSREHLEAFHRLGARRASFGIQDFNPEVQKAVNRIQPKELSDRAAAWIREIGYDSLNIDLIYGLPHQTPETFARTIELALELNPDRFAIFNYAHVPWMKPAQKIVERAVLPTPETKLAMLKTVIETLTDNGYVYIGMDHFAREDDELAIAQRSGTLWRNFQGYSTRAGVDIYGFGMSSISQTPTHYRQNEKKLEDWEKRLEAGELPYSRACFLTDEDKLRHDVIMRLMCDLALDFDAMSEKHGIDFRARFAPEIEALRGAAEDGLITFTDRGFEVTDIGRLLIRNLAMTFDAYLGEAENRFSRTI